MNTPMTKCGPENVALKICVQTKVRIEACACRACARFAAPAAKYQAKRRDALALLERITSLINDHPTYAIAKPNWTDVEQMAHVRGNVMRLAIDLTGSDDEWATRLRIDEALCAEDDDVQDALTSALR